MILFEPFKLVWATLCRLHIPIPKFDDYNPCKITKKESWHFTTNKWSCNGDVKISFRLVWTECVFESLSCPNLETKALSLTIPVPIPDEEKKIKLNFYFHTSLWCLKRFYECLKGPHKTFKGITKKCEDKHLT